MLELLGIIGGLLLSFSALPQTLSAMSQKNTLGLNKYFIMLWWSGILCMTVYTAGIDNPVLFINYITNFVLVSIILRYTLWPCR